MWRKATFIVSAAAVVAGALYVALWPAPELASASDSTAVPETAVTQKTATVPQPAFPPIPHALDAPDQNGGMQNLASLAPNKGVVLVFTRSLHW